MIYFHVKVAIQLVASLAGKVTLLLWAASIAFGVWL